MPVPVAATNPDGKGLSVHKNSSLPSTGSLFSRLGADSATKAMDEKMVEQSVDRKDRRTAQSASNGATHTTSSSEPAIVCRELQFRYVGDDGMPIAGMGLGMMPVCTAMRAARNNCTTSSTSLVRACTRHAHSHSLNR